MVRLNLVTMNINNFVLTAEEHGHPRAEMLATLNHEKNTPLHAAISGGDMKVGEVLKTPSVRIPMATPAPIITHSHTPILRSYDPYLSLLNNSVPCCKLCFFFSHYDIFFRSWTCAYNTELKLMLKWWVPVVSVKRRLVPGFLSRRIPTTVDLDECISQ